MHVLCHRSMDMVHAFEVERVQALRFIRKVCNCCWFIDVTKIVCLACMNIAIKGYSVNKLFSRQKVSCLTYH